jgi:PHD/YefM family antitoxin component YafN of YafNO toxin-antitoxin module
MKTTLKKEPQFITDKNGKKVSVVIDINDYKKIMEEIEELEDIKLYDLVKARKEKTKPLSEYIKRRRKNA